MKISVKFILSIVFIGSFVSILPCGGQAGVIVHTKNAIDFKLQGYDGLESFSIDNATLPADAMYSVDASYRGLAMLIFPGGQTYPLIIGSSSSVVTITNVDETPSFAAGDENQIFYKLLASDIPVDSGNSFAGVMIRGKHLLDSSSSIKNVKELHNKKKAFQKFIQHNYGDISRSDLLRRLIGQYFMMHEYVSYHLEGSHSGDIQSGYRREVLSGVKSLLTLLQNHIPENELLNYCVGLYYKRGMVTMASFIADNFESIAYCGESEQQPNNIPKNQTLINADGSGVGKWGELKGEKILSFVSSDCPVSMVRTVIKAREIAEGNKHGKNQILIVVPLEQLSETHRAMRRNVNGGTMLFVNETRWLGYDLQDMRLPFIR